MTVFEIHIQIQVHTKKTFSRHSKIHLSNATYLIIQVKERSSYHLFSNFSFFRNILACFQMGLH